MYGYWFWCMDIDFDFVVNVNGDWFWSSFRVLKRECCVFFRGAQHSHTLNDFFIEMQSQPLIKCNLQVSNLGVFWARDHFSKACFI